MTVFSQKDALTLKTTTADPQFWEEFQVWVIQMHNFKNPPLISQSKSSQAKAETENCIAFWNAAIATSYSSNLDNSS
ncbi:hypothetical protein MC7420_4876 [Coleofasciculus chthonoplastes PCC 7420]|uniref:Uncharacterized protein n=1 Tax=Coleofasciculus chthonoplastes PCC 7420 TaxID=118168 RepID=B4VN70_9CYAN|nr:hypothetical protein MC7420_4876 [Coleofasciculus chthonoplastes PCC 7420]